MALPAAALAATTATAAAVATAEQGSPRSSPTYLAAESAPPPAQDSLSGSGASATAITAGERPDRYASLPTNPPAPVPLTPGQVSPVRPAISTNSSAAFASAWADAHEKLAAGRYAEALTALSIWYDDPSLGLEESQRLDDLLGQLAGTVIYSQHHLLLPPRIVAPGETLASVAAPLGVSWQLLGKINGVANPQELFPGEHLKVVRGPFDAVVSVSRRRLSLQLGGNYAGSFPVGVGRDFMSRVGSSIPVSTSGGALAAEAHAAGITPGHATPSIALVDGLRIDAVDDPSLMSENTPPMSLVVTGRDFADIVDILGPGSKVLIRQ